MMEIMSKRNVTSHILALLLLLQLSNAFDNGGLTKIITTTHRINNKFLNGSNYRVVDLLESSTFNNKHSTSSSITRLRAWGSNNEEDLEEKEEEARLKVLESRRKTIRSALKSAESLKNFRVNNGRYFYKIIQIDYFLNCVADNLLNSFKVLFQTLTKRLENQSNLILN